MADEKKPARIIWVHGMGDKPDHSTAPLGRRAELEREASWAPLAEGAWLPIDPGTYHVAYWADLRKGTSKAKGEPPSAFPRPRPETLHLLSAGQRAALNFAYIQTPAAQDEWLNRQASQTEQRSVRVRHATRSARRGWRLLLDYLGRPHVLFYTLLATMIGMFASIVNRMNIPRQLRIGKLMGFLLQDLYPYVRNENGVREQIIDRVIEQLEEAYSDGREICLITQSMGTIVALDALYKWQCLNGRGKVQTFVTLACPLGIKRLRKYIWPKGVEAAESFDAPTKELPYLPFPVNVGQWFNLYDKWDYTTILDSDLANDFPERRFDYLVGDREGQTREYCIPRIIDIPTRPNYNRDYMREPHDWYGFLSSPQVADIVCHFWLGATMEAAASAGAETEEPQPPEHLINPRRSGSRIGGRDETDAGEPADPPTGETVEATAPASRAGEHSDGQGGSG